MLYNGYVYVYVNVKTGQKYVGQTCNIKQRHVSHLCKKSKTYFDNSLQKDPNSFKLIILSVFCSTSKEQRDRQLNQLEKYWIKKLHTYWYKYPKLGYNLTVGGDGAGNKKRRCKISIYDFNTKKEYEKAKYQLRKEQIAKYRKEHKDYFKQQSQKYRDLHKDKINQQRRENRKKNPKLITEEQRAKNRERMRKHRLKINPNHKSNRKIILQLDLNNNLIKQYDSIKQVIQDLNLTYDLVKRLCTNKPTSTSYNYKLQYQNESNI